MVAPNGSRHERRQIRFETSRGRHRRNHHHLHHQSHLKTRPSRNHASTRPSTHLPCGRQSAPAHHARRCITHASTFSEKDVLIPISRSRTHVIQSTATAQVTHPLRHHTPDALDHSGKHQHVQMESVHTHTHKNVLCLHTLPIYILL